MLLSSLIEQEKIMKKTMEKVESRVSGVDVDELVGITKENLPPTDHTIYSNKMGISYVL